MLLVSDFSSRHLQWQMSRRQIFSRRSFRITNDSSWHALPSRRLLTQPSRRFGNAASASQARHCPRLTAQSSVIRNLAGPKIYAAKQNAREKVALYLRKKRVGN